MRGRQEEMYYRATAPAQAAVRPQLQAGGEGGRSAHDLHRSTGCMYVANSSYLCTPTRIVDPFPDHERRAVTSGIEAAYKILMRKKKYEGPFPMSSAWQGRRLGRYRAAGDVGHDVPRHDALFICYDNESYANTGIQTSPTTPYGAQYHFHAAGQGDPEGQTLFRRMPSARDRRHPLVSTWRRPASLTLLT